MKIKAVLFDMDGVLVDSERIMLASAIEMLRRRGVDAVEADFTPFIGAGEVAYLGGAARVHGAEYEPEMTGEAYRIYEELVNGQDIGYPGAVKTVKKLRETGIKCAVCTSADRDKLRINLCGLGLRDGFDALITGQDITANKPSPQIYQKGADALGMLPGECVVIEDAKNGILAAKAAGMRNIALTTTFSADELKRAVNPEFIVPDITGILPIIEKINSDENE